MRPVRGCIRNPRSDDFFQRFVARDLPADRHDFGAHSAAGCRRQGATVTVYDPQAMPNARRLHPELGYADSVDEAVTALQEKAKASPPE